MIYQTRYRQDDSPYPRREARVADHTPYQQKIIKRYYDNQEALAAQKLAELVSDLYLTTGKKRQRVWESLESAMQKLGVPQQRIDHLKRQDKPALVAELVKELQGWAEGERRGVSPPVQHSTGGLTPRRSPSAFSVFRPVDLAACIPSRALVHCPEAG